MELKRPPLADFAEIAMVDAMSRLAREAEGNVFRGFAFMKSLIDVEGIPLDRMVDPFDNDRLHGSDWVLPAASLGRSRLRLPMGSRRRGHR